MLVDFGWFCRAYQLSHPILIWSMIKELSTSMINIIHYPIPLRLSSINYPFSWSVNKYHQLCRLPVGMFKDTLCRWIHQFLGTSRGVSVFVQTGVSIQWPCFVGKMNSKPFVVCVFPTCSDKPICVHIYNYIYILVIDPIQNPIQDPISV